MFILHFFFFYYLSFSSHYLSLIFPFLLLSYFVYRYLPFPSTFLSVHILSPLASLYVSLPFDSFSILLPKYFVVPECLLLLFQSPFFPDILQCALLFIHPVFILQHSLCH